LTTAEYDLRFVEAGIDQLESYLLSNDIYRQIGIQPPAGSPAYPQLTLGWLLLSQLRAQATCVSGEQKVELDLLTTKLESLRSHWRSTWGNKALAEFHSRLNLWRDFLEDYRKNPDGNFDRYAYEINRRVMLHILHLEVEKLPDSDQKALESLDKLLHTVFIAGEFIWNAELIPSFPKSTYWYLYGALKREEAV
jgi:hypothetical protein